MNRDLVYAIERQLSYTGNAPGGGQIEELEFQVNQLTSAVAVLAAILEEKNITSVKELDSELPSLGYSTIAVEIEP